MREIKAVKLGYFSPDEVKRFSVAEIIYPDLFYSNKTARTQGLSDVRLGTIDQNSICGTCEQTFDFCPGHFGYVQLSCPCFNWLVLKRIKTVLECICYKCYRFRLADDDPKCKRLARVKDKLDTAWRDAKAKKKCDRCNAPVFTVRISKKPPIGLIGEYKTDKNEKKIAPEFLTPEDVFHAFERVDDETHRLLGLDPATSRVENLILTCLPIPPMAVRPSISIGGNGKGEDDLTAVYGSIIRFNEMVKNAPNIRALAKAKEDLRNHVRAVITNEVSGLPPICQKTNRPTKSLRARLIGKEGRIRGNLQGKRGDFSARSVIGGDPSLSCGEFGVPLSIAKVLVGFETVNELNRSQLQALVDRGPVYPGAKYVQPIAEDYRFVDLKFAKIKPILQIGDKVERHLVDGDLLLVNRQPTLHKMSAMAHRVKVTPNKNFTMNVCVTSSYNADFDGDEMNTFLSLTVQSRAELATLSTVAANLVSPQSNKPVNGLVQDALATIRFFTMRDTFVDRSTMMDLLMFMGTRPVDLPTPAILRPIPLWTGKQVISLCIPTGIDLVSHSSTHPDSETGDLMTPSDGRVVIDDGDLLSGILCKKTAGISANGIIHIIWNDRGPEAALNFMDDSSRMLNQWMLHRGFSVGVGDGLIGGDALETIRLGIEEKIAQVDDLLEDKRQGRIVAQGALTLDETAEFRIQNLLSSARDDSGRIVRANVKAFNNLKHMADAGSKGTILNISQIAGCLGQQIAEGKRMPYGFKNRTLPHFQEYDDRALSRGFVKSSFIKGLHPHELFFHAVGGREGLIDTAVKTAETGYFQRRMVKNMEDLVVAYDGSVRNEMGQVLQFRYGDDGMDGTAIEQQRFPTMWLADETFRKRFYAFEEEFKQLTEDRNFLRSTLSFEDEKIFLPLNVTRYLKSAQRVIDTDPNADPLSHQEVFYRVQQLRESLKLDHFDRDRYPCSGLFHIFISSTLASNEVINRWKLNRAGLTWILERIRDKYYKGKVPAGEAVGVIAAQSVGEPATQMTLNTFHSSGSGNKTVTSGMFRLKELINASKNIKTPWMSIYLREDIKTDRKVASRTRAKIEQCFLEDLLLDVGHKGIRVVKEADTMMDAQWLNVLQLLPKTWRPPAHLLEEPIIRIELDRNKLYHSYLGIDDVVVSIRKVLGGDVYIQYSPDTCPILVIHIRFFKEVGLGNEQTKNPVTSCQEFAEMLREKLPKVTLVAGRPGIHKAFIVKKMTSHIGPIGDIVSSHEYVIETEGSNLRDVMDIEEIDPNRISSNDPNEAYRIYGVEAARQVTKREIREVITEGSSYINDRHLSLLVDTMFHRGRIMGFTRHGGTKNEAGFFKRSSFEQTVDVLVDAALNNDLEPLKGVSARVMTGKLMKMGSSVVDVIPDKVMEEEILETRRSYMPAFSYSGAGKSPYAHLKSEMVPMVC